MAQVVDSTSVQDSGASPEDSLRVNTYGLLGSLLAGPPTRELLGRLGAIEPDSSQPEHNQDNPVAAAWHAVAGAARAASPSALDDEYHDLFIGLGRGELMPYGSWYMTGYLMERPLAYLRRDLQRLGFARQESVKEPEDHAGALLETMSLMIDAGIGEHEQRRFFNEHIEPWMGRFFRDLQEAKSASFYSAVGALGERFLEIEKQYLAMVPH